ncbi:SAP30-binding protein [Fasciola gigantica]|uniref:SAP30-binding protein n=1 Tax=Fasciola gigantica TaxID=46835 RepID=A0A504WVB5_FASGI|nr:SAP30-binding protein [Fasciola gigantica]
MEDPDAPKIYTSDDERDLTSNQKRLNSVLSQSDPTSTSASTESKIPKKSQLVAPPSLVSYAIDDDDEPTLLSDEGTSDVGSDHSKRSEQNKETEETGLDVVMDTSASPVATEDFPFINLDEPPTILSSEHQISKEPIHVFSQDHLQNLPVTSEVIPEQDSTWAQSDLSEKQGNPSVLEEVQLPPEPTGHCRMELQEKVDREVRRMRLDISYDPNRAIQDNKAFRNPSIYEKLISFLNIDEKGTNFPQVSCQFPVFKNTASIVCVACRPRLCW